MMPPISTQNLNLLPDIPTLRKLTQSLAILDAIVIPEWEFRYYSFNAHWADGEMMAYMRNGSGDEWFLLFGPQGAIMKGFALHSAMERNTPWPGVLNAVPPGFESFLSEAAFSIHDTTYCIWRSGTDESWRRGEIAFPPDIDDPDGSQEHFAILDGAPETYQQWAEEDYEVELPLEAISHIYEYRPLTPDIAAMLNADVAWDDLAPDIAEIGYPVASDMPENLNETGNDNL
ncbi:hypothetical protein CCAX7_53560 [Capsulimonas corticalis]|uniref:Uncharacterized protein n=1 Tax=Capsulimonas corticalis TaxID=2219043 RepID=A0A402CNF8_9BACT|nr:hypothetical protein [Capsulimonas corticalis]BDI33305.1 hypothetical protein CCAX7_53560 [Capsulimonas corticalis]